MDPNCIETANGFIIVPEHDDDANASADSGGYANKIYTKAVADIMVFLYNFIFVCFSFWSFLGGGKKEKKEEKKIHHKSYRPSLRNHLHYAYKIILNSV